MSMKITKENKISSQHDRSKANQYAYDVDANLYLSSYKPVDRVSPNTQGNLFKFIRILFALLKTYHGCLFLKMTVR